MSKRRKTALMINLLLVLLECFGFITAIWNNGWSIMEFYTQDSNLVLLIASAAYSIVLMKEKNREIPRWASVLKYTATSLVVVTFIVVLTVLIPMCYPNVNYMVWMLLGGSNLFHHLLCPVLAVVSFIFFEDGEKPGITDNLLAALPTLLYAVVTLILNSMKIMHGPYPFLYVYEQPVWASALWFIGIVGAAYLFAWILRKAVRREKYECAGA